MGGMKMIMHVVPRDKHPDRIDTAALSSEISIAGFSVEKERLEQWAKVGLIARVGSDYAQWPPEAAWEAAAACYLLDDQGFTEDEVRTGRHFMGEILARDGNPVEKLAW